jgi:hypothetical protein
MTTPILVPLAGSYISGADGILMPIHVKAPWDTKDYPFDWALHLLPDESISAVDFIPSSQHLSLLSKNIGDGLKPGSLTICWLYGGLLDTNYSVAIRVTTNHGRQMERTFQMSVGRN